MSTLRTSGYSSELWKTSAWTEMSVIMIALLHYWEFSKNTENFLKSTLSAQWNTTNHAHVSCRLWLPAKRALITLIPTWPCLRDALEGTGHAQGWSQTSLGYSFPEGQQHLLLQCHESELLGASVFTSWGYSVKYTHHLLTTRLSQMGSLPFCLKTTQ